jgi:hypothetical protein
MNSQQNAASPAPARRAVVRIAAGARQKRPEAQQSEATAGKPTEGGAFGRSMPKLPSPKIEINPKLQSSKGLIKPVGKTNEKPMSVAQKHRANAEAMFAKVTGRESSPPPPPTASASSPASAERKPAAPPPPPMPAPPPPPTRDPFGAIRISERDSLTTALRLAPSSAAALDAAKQLADRYQLPPDQNLLVKVIELSDARLTKLALEELLELDDRGRVRPSTELRSAISGVKSADHETEELKQLFLQKIGAGA